MGFFRQFRALLWKNWLLKKRNLCSSLCELLLPVFFIVVMVIIYRLFSTDSFQTQELTAPTNVRTVQPMAVLPARLSMMRNKVAVIPRSPSLSPMVDQFITDMSALHPAFNGSRVGGGAGFDRDPLRSLYIPGFGDVVRKFDSEDELQSFLTSRTYDTDWEAGVGDKIWGAIVFNSGPPHLDYSIRMNVSMVPSTSGDPVDVLRQGQSFAEIDKYAEAVLNTNGPPFLRDAGTEVSRQGYPGFLTLQLAIDKWILNTSVPVTSLDPIKVSLRFNDAVRRMLPNRYASEFVTTMTRINATSPSTALAILSDIQSWMAEDAYAPQQVDFVPFPFFGYQRNGFYGLVLTILSFFLVIGFVYPVSRLIRGIVLEKEMKIREGMKMMGLSDAALFGSWLATYTIFWAVLAAIIAGVASKSLFQHSTGGIVWALFFLFGMSSTTFCYLISVFFSRAKTASSLGIVIYIAAYFPTFSVSGSDVSTGTKLASSLLCPTAFGLGINLLGTLESNGAGATKDTVGAVINNYSVQGAFGMMILDTFLYGILAWYIDNILPASIREFGVPRAWYFPFTMSYWREVLNLPVKPTGASITKATAGSSSSPSSSVPKVDASYIEEADADLKAKETQGRCVAVRGLRKEFATPDGTKVAVDDVDMTMYEGQIFVLLGHNGAGKTTTISMLTGLIPPTSGGASVFGRDVSSQMTQVRQDLGVCPQHDVLWPELTVKEHLQIFTELKNVPRAKCNDEIKKAIADVGLTEKVDSRSSALSGGQKRKLSVCIALAGGSRVIFLDEPTSGMDPYSRRSTWQILQNAREGRVMVLTTHFMDEADILGDRIAIMADGRVRCSGSPTFLKRRFGVGYILTLIKTPGAGKADAAVALVRKHVPEVTVATNVGAELSLRLPLGASSVFPAMLQDLDSNLVTTGVSSYGISITSVEDVFLKIAAGDHFSGGAQSHAHAASPANGSGGSAVEDPNGSRHSTADSSVTTINVVPKDGRAANASPDVTGTTTSIASQLAISNKLAGVAAGAGSTGTGSSDIDAVRAEMRKEQTGFQTFLRHTGALLTKRWNYSKRDGKALGYQILLPAVMIAGGLGLIQSGQRNTFPNYQFTTANFNVDKRKDPVSPRYPNIVPNFHFKAGATSDSSDIANVFGEIPNSNASMTAMSYVYSDLTSISDPYGFVTATTEPRRTFQQMSAVLLNDAPLRAGTKYGAYVYTKDGTIVPSQSSTATVPTGNAATYAVFYNSSGIHSAPLFMNIQNSALWKSRNGGVGSITARNHPLPRTEREQALFAGLLVFSAAIIIVIAFSFQAGSTALYIVKEKEVAAKQQQLISGVSTYAYWLSNFIFDTAIYLISAVLAVALAFAFNIKEFVSTDDERLAAFLLTFALFGVALIGSTYLLSYFFKSPSSAQNTILFINIAAILLISASSFLSQLPSACRAEYALRFIFRLLPSYSFGYNLVQLAFLTQAPLIDATCDLSNGVAFDATKYLPYKALELKSTGTSLIFLAVEGLAYFVGVLLVEYILSQPKLALMFKKDPVVAATPHNEDEDVAAEAARVKAQVASGNVSDVVVLDDIKKVYPTGKVAVKGLSYGIPVGEVFGFLGINGAGKTTTLQMLSGDVLPTSGTAKLAGFDIISQQPQVRRLLGYCPQFDALLELLTVKEHLELYARIKGVPEKEVQHTVESKLKEFDLVQFKNKKAGTLSGGNKRKLSVAIALIGSPPIVFLDEPSTGMDPVARRFMWSVISRVATERKQCSIILTTHSMEEVEALCTRIGIMVGGRLRCLGTAQHLKNRHGAGYLSEVKLSAPSELAIAAIMQTAASAIGNAAVITRAQVSTAAAALGVPARAEQMSDLGSGWAIHAAFNKAGPTGSIPLHDFAMWWAGEQAARNLCDYMAHDAFPGSQLVERQGTTLRFRIPMTQEQPLSSLFAKLEIARSSLSVSSYTLGQTSLEQIFVQFAGQQDEEAGVARGMVKPAGAGAAQLQIQAPAATSATAPMASPSPSSADPSAAV